MRTQLRRLSNLLPACIRLLLTFTFITLVGDANAEDQCRVEVGDTNSAVQDYKATTRNVSSSCTKEGADCAGAKQAAEDALAQVIAAHQTMLNVCVGPTPPPPPAPPPTTTGDLVITEFMADPESVADSSGEWFEIFNPTTTDFDLNGLVVKDDGLNQFTINTSLIVPASGFLVFGINGNQNTNGGVQVDFVYTNFALANATDQIEIFSGTTSLDRVAYTSTSFPIGPGEATSLDPDAFTSTANDNGANWCAAVTPLPGGDTGTPKQTNPQC